MLRRGDWVIHFALQALQLHATPANPSPHNSQYAEKLHRKNMNAPGKRTPRTYSHRAISVVKSSQVQHIHGDDVHEKFTLDTIV